MAIPDAAGELFARQHGTAARRQLLALGYPPDEIDGWRQRRFMHRVHRGVYRAAGVPETPHLALMAAVLRSGPEARADGWATSWLLGLEGFEHRVGTVVPLPHQVSGAPFPAKATVLERADLLTVDGIPCLSVVRALIEVAPLVREKALRVAIDSARRQGLLSIPALRRRALALATHHGARIILRVLGSGAMDQESEGERFLARFLRGFDGIEWGVKDVVPGRRLDGFDRAALLVLEWDGRDHHVLPTDRDHDGLRDIEIRSTKVGGVRLDIIRITKGMVDADPEGVRAFVRLRIEERRAEIARLRNTELPPQATAIG